MVSRSQNTLEDRVCLEIQEVVIRNSYVGIAGGCLALLGLFLLDIGDDETRYIVDRWCLALAVCLLGRIFAVSLDRFQRSLQTQTRSTLPFYLYYGFSAVEGVVWGMAIWVIFPSNVLDQAFLMIILIAVAVGAMATFSGSMSLYAIYVCSILGLAALKLATLDARVYKSLASLTPVLLMVLLVIARQMNHLILDTLRLGFRNEQLAQIEAASKESIVDFGNKLSVKTTELEHITGRLRRLVTILSHDLRDKLLTMCQYSRFLAEGKKHHDRQTVIQTLQKAAENGLQLVDDLLEATGLEPEEIQVALVQSPIISLVERAVQRVQSSAEDKGVKIHLAVDEVRPVRVDIRRMEEVLANIIATAIDHTPSEGSVTVQSTPTVKGLRLEIIDTGTAFTNNEVNKLLMTPQQGRWGKLASSEEILKNHNSHLEVKNNPTTGSCFSFVLPWGD
jgi:signal transduction histidine kinase